MKRIPNLTLKLFLFVCSLALAISSCTTKMVPPLSCADKRVYKVPLNYTPTKQIQPLWTVIIGEQKIFFQTIKDERKLNSTQIGKNIQDEVPYFVCAQESNPSDFMAQSFRETFEKVGVTIVEEATGADLIFEIALKEFWVLEENVYQAKISAIIEVKDGSGKTLWRRPMFGIAKNWGRSHSVTNYNQTFSNAAINLMQNLINDQKFQQLIAAK